MTATAPQTELRLPKVVVPLLTVEALLAELEVERTDALKLVDEGALTGVLDVSAGMGEVRELRFARQCVEEWRAGQREIRTDEELAELVFGGYARTTGFTTRNSARRRLVVTWQTMGALTHAETPRRLRLATGSAWRPGPGGSPVITWAELVRFVGERRQEAVRSDAFAGTPARTPNQQ